MKTLNLMIKKFKEFLNENFVDNFAGVSPTIMASMGIDTEDISHCIKIAREIRQEIGDKGTCVIGAGLYCRKKDAGSGFKSYRIVDSYSQGNTGPEKIFSAIQNYLQNTGKYKNLIFEIEWGNMD